MQIHPVLTILTVFILACQSEKKQVLYAGAPMVADTTVFIVMELQPVFPGGHKALEAFIAQHITYPAEDLEKAPAGTTYIQCIVERNGSLSNFSVVRTPSKAMAKEALRICALMPAWQPGTSMGKAHRCRVTLPFHFKVPKA